MACGVEMYLQVCFATDALQACSLLLSRRVLRLTPQDMAKAGADMYSFHLECPCFEQPETPTRVEAVAKLAEAVHEAGMHVGVALRPSTPVSAVLPYLEAGDLDLVGHSFASPGCLCSYHSVLCSITGILSCPFEAPPLIRVGSACQQTLSEPIFSGSARSALCQRHRQA